MVNTTPSRGTSLKDIRDAISEQLARGTRPEVVINQLIKRGWPEISARRFVESTSQTCVEAPAGSQERQVECQRCVRCALRGLLCTIIGFALIVVGLWMEDVPNGIFHFTGGVLLCVFEIHDLLAGISGWIHNRR